MAPSQGMKNMENYHQIITIMPQSHIHSLGHSSIPFHKP